MSNPWAMASLLRLEHWAADKDLPSGALDRLRAGLLQSLSGERSGRASAQSPEVFIPDLRAHAWWGREEFPWLSALEAATPVIRQEFQAASASGTRATVEHPSGLADAGHWNAYYFYYVGRPYDAHLTKCPETARALESVPGVAECGMTYFSVLAPGAHVAPHSGFTNAHLRCHLALEVPAEGKCRMRVGQQTRTWREGEAFVFDDSFEHEVWNDNRTARVVLLLDTWHPELTAVEIDALSVLVTEWRRLLYRQTLSKATTNRRSANRSA